jgi:hypothetical protein
MNQGKELLDYKEVASVHLEAKIFGHAANITHIYVHNPCTINRVHEASKGCPWESMFLLDPYRC